MPLSGCRADALVPQAAKSWITLAPIELREIDIDKLISKGYLNEVMRNDARAIIQALYDYLDGD